MEELDVIEKNIITFEKAMRMDDRSERTIKHYKNIFKLIPRQFMEVPNTLKFNRWLVELDRTSSMKNHIGFAYKSYLKCIGSEKQSSLVKPGKYKSNVVTNFMTREYLEIMLDKTKDKEMALILKILFYTGMRRSILLYFRKEMIDKENKGIFINDTKLPGNKAKEQFFIAFPHWLFNELIVYVNKCKIKEKDRVFVVRNSSGLPVSYEADTFTLRVCALAKKAGLPKWVSPHKFRHGFATDHMKRGGKQEYRMETMGQKDPKSQKRYSHVQRGEQSKEAQKLYDREETV